MALSPLDNLVRIGQLKAEPRNFGRPLNFCHPTPR